MMKSRMLSAVALLALFVIGASGPEARGQGFHFGSGGVHVDVGNPHGYYDGYGGYGGYGWGGYGNCGYGGYGSYPYTAYYGGGWNAGGGHAHWHDTTHLDYHPGEYVRHRNHYHYAPGHYDVHEDGHWDVHGF